MSASNRRQPARSARTSTTRPSNYYARPYGFPGATSAPVDNEPAGIRAPGFYPAITHFTDGIAALPKEVMRHFTTLRETEGKAYAPDQAIAELVGAINKLPEPPRQRPIPHTQAYLGFSLNNSLAGSVNGSVVDGHLPGASQIESIPSNPLAHSSDAHAASRGTMFLRLRERLKEMMTILDEKNMVLTSANETLARQLARLEDTIPYVEAEISEEARLGSDTHWALSHMKEQRKANGVQPTDRARRDVQAANNLAAAAAVVGEIDLAASRSEARREALQAKRKNHNVDSDFDDRPGPKRVQTSAKVRKVQDNVGATEAKGTPTVAPISQSHKRKRVEKLVAPPLERQISSLGRAATGKDIPSNSREVPATEGARKKAKPIPAPALVRKKNLANSPSVVSSPTRGTFATTTTTSRDYSPAPSNQRVVSARGRQNSNQSIRSVIQDRIRGTALTATNGKASAMAKATTPDVKTAAEMTGLSVNETRAAITEIYTNAYGERTIEEAGVSGAIAMNTIESKQKGPPKREEAEVADTEEAPPQAQPEVKPEATSVPMVATRSRNGVSKPSKPATPVNGIPEGVVPAPLSRSRSTRGINPAFGPIGAISSPPVGNTDTPRRSHKRGANAQTHAVASPAQSASSTELPAAIQARSAAPLPATARAVRSPSTSSAATSVDEAGPEGPSSPASDEPRYCVCGGVSYGDMIACDNDGCPTEWFHLHCVGLTKAPGSKAKWYCDECKEVLRRGGRAVA